MDRNRFTLYGLWALLGCLLLLSGGCADDGDFAAEAATGGEGGKVYVSVTVNTGRVDTRTPLPQPGEEGDGPQAGVGDENRVHDLNLFFFQTPDGQGINTADAASVPVTCVYFDRLQPDAASSGDITRYTTPVREVQGLAVGQTYQVLAVANYGAEMKTTEGEKLGTLAALRDYIVTDGSITGNSAEGKHFRMASAGPGVNEITVLANNSENNPATITIGVERMAARVDYRIQETYTPEGHTGDKVSLLSATLVNKATGGSYAFKRVATLEGDPITVTYLGDEPVDASTGKANGYVLDPYTMGNGERTYEKGYASFSSWADAQDTWSAIRHAAGETDEEYQTLDYTEENVAIVSGSSLKEELQAHCTGILFKARYTPQGIEENTTFYWYAGTFYASLDAITEQHPDEFQDVELTDENLGEYGIQKYTEGICYYTYWLRHADDEDPATVSPMEYAVVRNNVYRLNVTKVTGIGGSTPSDEGKLIVRISVAPWREDIDLYPDFN